MRITKTSPLTGEQNTMDLDITPEQIIMWEVGKCNIQEVMPHLTAEEREFLISGYTPEDWLKLFGKDEEE